MDNIKHTLIIGVLTCWAMSGGNILNTVPQVSTPYGQMNIPGAVFKGSYSPNVASGDVDLYTAPAGKRTMIIGANLFNSTGGAINCFMEFKVGGTYFRGQPAITGLAATTATVSTSYFPFVLEPGDSVSINTTAIGINVQLRMVEYPSSVRVYSPRLTTLVASTNTLYTVPASTVAILISSILSQGLCTVTNSSVGSVIPVSHVVPSGGTVGTTNQTDTLTVLTLNGKQLACAGTLNSGDFIDITSNSAVAGQFAWVTVMEMAQ